MAAYENTAEATSVDYGNESNSVENEGKSATIICGSGNDTITNSTTAGSASINAGDGNNVVDNRAAGVTITSGAGNDSISSDANSVLINSGAGKDTIESDGNEVTINGGDGDNFVYSYGNNVSIVVGAGKNLISIENGNKISVTSGAGDDTVIFSNGSEMLIDVGNGNNSVENAGDNVTIISGTGNDTISNSDDNVLFKYGGGNDVIEGFKSSSTLQIVSGAITSALTSINAEGKGDAVLTVDSNTIILKGLGTVDTINVMNASGESEIFNIPILITGTNDSDSISNENIGAIIQALGGDDSISNNTSVGSGVSINAGAGNDYVENIAENVTINGGDGADSIQNNNYADYAKVFGDAGDDYIYNLGMSTTLDGGDGADSIDNYSDNVLINAGAGNDYIYNYYSSGVSINAGAGDDTISNTNGTVLINIGEGNNSVENINADNVSIISGAGADSIVNTNGANMLFQYGGGSDIVEGFNETSTLQIMAGGISSAFSNGVDAIFTIGSDILTLKNLGLIRSINVMDASGAVESFNTPVLIEGTDSIDDISNDVEGVTIKAFGGDDYISNSAASVTIDGGDGNVLIENSGDNVSILGGTGNYEINNSGASNVTIDAGDGKNTVYSSGENVIINSGEGKSYIDNRGDAVSITGGKGNYEIDNNGVKVTINAGKGNDTVTLSTSYNDDGNIFLYKKGDGKDQIYSENENDTIKITDGSSVTADVKGDDVIFKIGTGSITFKDGADDLNGKKIILVDSENNPLLEENIYVPAGIIVGDTIQIAASFTETYWQGDGVNFIDGSQLKDGIELVGMDDNCTILGSKGKDSISSSNNGASLTGGKGNDVFTFGGGNATINDYSVKGTNGADKIYLENTSVTSYMIDADNNLVLTCDETNTLTIRNGGNKKIIFTDNKAGIIYTADGAFDGKRKSIVLPPASTNFSAAKHSKLATIDGTAATDAINILGNKKANYIMAGNYGSTLNGGKGKDSLNGGDGDDLFIYENKSGNDTIYYYVDGDKVSLGSGVTIKDATIKRNSAVLRFKGGSLTVDSTTDFILVGDSAETVFSSGVFLDTVSATAKIYGSFKDDVFLDAYENIANFDATAGTKALFVNGNAENNSLIGGKGKDELRGGDGADTIFGGKGNDTLWGETGADIFVYQASTGNDVIADYERGELVQILDKKGNATTFTDAIFNADTLTLEINGGGKITFQSVTNETEFNINGDTYTVSGTTLRTRE